MASKFKNLLTFMSFSINNPTDKQNIINEVMPKTILFGPRVPDKKPA